jgi:hypothetical protein
MDNENHNGNRAGAEPVLEQRLVLTFNPATFKLHIDFDVLNLDCAASMLAQAQRFVEGKLRIASALALQQEMAEAQRTKDIVDRVGKSGLRA